MSVVCGSGGVGKTTTAAAIGLAAGAVGALYPAIRAANQDPVKALSYE